MAAQPRPLFLAVFANDKQDRSAGYLRDLSSERRRVQQVFDAHPDLPVEPDFRFGVTYDELLHLLDTYNDRIVALHFGGHADRESLVFEAEGGATESIRGAGLATRLGELPNLKLVFLNGCATAGHVEIIRAAASRNAPLIIATERAIRDDVAAAFAGSFYQALAKGLPLRTAFQAAVSQPMGRFPNPDAARSPELSLLHADEVEGLAAAADRAAAEAVWRSTGSEVTRSGAWRALRLLRPAVPTDDRWPWGLFVPTTPEVLDLRLFVDGPEPPRAQHRAFGAWIGAVAVALALVTSAFLIRWILIPIPPSPDQGIPVPVVDAEIPDAPPFDMLPIDAQVPDRSIEISPDKEVVPPPPPCTALFSESAKRDCCLALSSVHQRKSCCSRLLRRGNMRDMCLSLIRQ